jgi:hypothetical protein
MQIIRRRLGAKGWRELLARFAGSGLTTQSFCQREAVSTASFYRWRALLGTPPGRDLALAPPANITPNTFVDLGTLGASGVRSDRLELRLDLGAGVTLQLVRG